MNRYLKGGLTALLTLFASHAALAGPIGATGPDAYGYTGDDIAYNYRNMSGATTFSLLDDQMSGAIGLGFDFDFYGSLFNSVHVSSNGFLDFDGGSHGCCVGRQMGLTDSYGGGLIAGFWEDIDPGNGGQPFENVLRYDTQGSVGMREFIVEFLNVDHYFDGNNVTFQMILHEGSNNIEFQYQYAPSDGGTHSIGIESPDQTIGLQVLLQGSGAPLPLQNQGYLITASSVPAPLSLGLLGTGLALMGLVSRRRG